MRVEGPLNESERAELERLRAQTAALRAETSAAAADSPRRPPRWARWLVASCCLFVSVRTARRGALRSCEILTRNVM
jgi:hypothetical protein